MSARYLVQTRGVGWTWRTVRETNSEEQARHIACQQRGDARIFKITRKTYRLIPTAPRGGTK